ncbi:MAG TPA: hypothetical protein VF528_02920 [Pyrinomonadaceae bacterium]|jgi:uncharacterized Zn finger protein (UPF0148 family)
MQSITHEQDESGSRSPELIRERECPACGTTARRAAARFCATCGRTLTDGYLPADSLRASYYLQQQQLLKQSQQRTETRQQPQQQQRPLQQQQRSQAKPFSQAPAVNGASVTALAFVTYSLVPYLGILFCPGAIFMGGIGLLNWHRAPYRGGRRAAYAGIVFGLIILCAQIFLWWILYKVPQWARL